MLFFLGALKGYGPRDGVTTVSTEIEGFSVSFPSLNVTRNGGRGSDLLDVSTLTS